MDSTFIILLFLFTVEAREDHEADPEVEKTGRERNQKLHFLLIKRSYVALQCVCATFYYDFYYTTHQSTASIHALTASHQVNLQLRHS